MKLFFIPLLLVFTFTSCCCDDAVDAASGNPPLDNASLVGAWIDSDSNKSFGTILIYLDESLPAAAASPA